MATRFSSRNHVRTLVLLAVFTALVAALSYIRIPLLGTFSFTLTLPVIVIGGALCGVWGGLWLGTVFSVMVFVTGEAAGFLAINIPATIAVVMLKGMAAGFVATFVYHALKNKSQTLAAACAAVTAPIANTGIFVIGSFLFFFDDIKAAGLAKGFESGVTYLFSGMIGLNFFVELAIGVVLTPVIIRLIDLVKNKKFSR